MFTYNVDIAFQVIYDNMLSARQKIDYLEIMEFKHRSMIDFSSLIRIEHFANSDSYSRHHEASLVQLI